MSIPRPGNASRLAILSYGFRPFFLFGAIYAGFSIALWLSVLFGRLQLQTTFSPVDWHIHEMLFGYAAAIVAGFMLTAIPNWTGRLPVQGAPLLGLVVLWLAGRLAVAFSAEIGWLAAAVVDCLFLSAIAAAAAIEVAAGRNWRNLKVVAAVSILLLANIGFHLEAHYSGSSDDSRRLGVGGLILLVMLIGGRIIPSFTRNWLVRHKPGRLPVPFGRFDMAAVGLCAAALAFWVVMPEGMLTGLAMLVAAALQTARLARWAGYRALRDPLVAILHVAFMFVPVGFVLAAAAALAPETVSQAAALHAFGIGAIGTMTLSVMVRATLGHTGRPLVAGRAGILVFAAVILAALTRLLAAFAPAYWSFLLTVAAVAWMAAFLGFALLFGPMLLRPRLGG